MKGFWKRVTSGLLLLLMVATVAAPMAGAASAYTEAKAKCKKCDGTDKDKCFPCKETGTGKFNKSSKCYYYRFEL